jgi:hemoglobin
MTSGSHPTDGQAPSVQSTTSPQNPHFAAVGAAGVSRLVERFYFHMNTRPEAAAIRALHPPDLTSVQEVLTRYLTEWLGGPPVYSTERGHPRLRRRHLPFRIGEAERDAWMGCMRAALSDVIAEPRLRAELTESFYRVADFLRNDAQHTHVHHASSPPRE